MTREGDLASREVQDKAQNYSLAHSSNDLSDGKSSTTNRTSPSNHQRMNNVPPAVPSPPSRRSPPPVALPNNQYPRLTSYRAYAMAAPAHLSLEQWLFTAQEIETSPSIDHGISPEEERTRRAKGVNFIYQAGILLKMPQITLQTAAVFLHRFYMRYSMVPEKGGIHHYVRTSLPRSKASMQRLDGHVAELTGGSMEQNIAATALFLASKAEETCRKTKEIVVAVARVAQKNASLIIDEQSKEFWRWRDNILAYEETMLELLTFDVVLTSPYHLLRAHLEGMDLVRFKGLRDTAWSFLNDSAMTTLCLRMPPRDIAVAAIYFGARFVNIRIPDDEEDMPWWHRLGGDPSQINEAVQVMAQFYMDNPLNKPDSELEQSPGSADEDLEKSRLRNGAGTPESFTKSGSVEGRNGHHSTNGSVANGDQQQYGNHDDNEKHNGGIKMEDSHFSKAEILKADTSRGDSDAALKEAANDPATHETSAPNGMNGIKRQASDANENNPAKRTKPNDVRASDLKSEASEEGELEE